MSRFEGYWPWPLGVLAVAILVHLASVLLLPRIIMWRLLETTTRTVGFNRMHHSERATGSSRGVVRPSPDLLYSICPYDLAKGPLLVRADVPGGTYWSASGFDAASNNFFVRDDRQVHGRIALLLTLGGGRAPLPRGAERVLSPTTRGVVLFRTLIEDETKLSDLDATRRRASCETYKSSPTGD